MIIDWADSYLGHPAADIHRLCQWVPHEQRATARQAWVEAWRAALPGCDPERALGPMMVLGHVLDAAVYQRFLDISSRPSGSTTRTIRPAEVRAALRVNQSAS